MFNISKQGSSLLITSNDNSQFPWKDGQMSLPMNSVVYVIDESDYIAFRSASNNDILFTALIDEIQINGTNVTKDDFILQFDNVANSAGGGGGSVSAGVNSINGFQGDLTLKSINGQSLIGSGDIEISGGASAGVNKIIMGDEDYGWNALSGDIKLTNGWMDLDDDGVQETYDIRVGDNETSSLWFGFNSTDNSIKIEDNGSRLSFTVNPDILGGGSTAGVEAINIGQDIQDWTQKTGVVPVYTLFYDGSYDVAVDGMSFYGLKPVDDSIVLESAGGTVNGNFRCGIKVNEDNFKTINGESIFGTGDITIQGGGSEPEQYVKSVTTDNVGSIFINNNDGTSDRIVFPLINGQQILGNGGNIEISGGSSEPEQYIVSIEDFWIYTKEEPYKKLWLQYIDSSDKNSITTKEIILEWTGTQSEYDALGEYDDSITYNIIEG